MNITWNTDVDAPGCPGEIVSEDGRTLLIQTDWDYPGVASSFGWSLREVQKCPQCETVLVVSSDDSDDTFVCLDCEYNAQDYEADHPGESYQFKYKCCEHDRTDGTVKCPACGLKPGDFIGAAYDWLCDNDGATAKDPGYFEERAHD